MFQPTNTCPRASSPSDDRNDTPMSTNAPLYGTSTRTTPTLHGRFFLTGIALVASLGAFLAPSLSTSAHQLPGPAATPPPHITGSEQETNPDVTGYRGSATNTNELSSAWASGVSTAWILPTSDTLLPAQLIAEGSTLYVLTYGSGSQAVATVSAYDVSGSEPVAQWTTTGPQPSRIRAEAFPSSVSTSEEILLSGIIVDRSTGAQTQAPWGSDLPMGVAGGVLVTCDTFSSCSGWSRDSGAWTRLWSTTTSPQRRAGLAHSGLTAPASAVIGSGAGAAVVVPVDEAHQAPQLINPATGAVTTLGEAPSAAGPSVSRITLASDGVLVAGEKESIAYNTAGEVVGTVGAGWELDRFPTSDRALPTTAELSSFMTQGGAQWTTATVERPYSKDVNGYLLAVSPTSGNSSRTINPGESFSDHAMTDPWSATQVRASADGKALFVQCLPSTPTGPFFFGVEREMTYVSPELDEATNLTWIFDDLLVGARSGEVIAVTPRTP